MANRLTLAFSVATAGTNYSPTQASAILAAAALYTSPGTDPILGQLFGVTVGSDVVSIGGVTYTGESGTFLPGETVTGAPSGAHAEVAVDEKNGMLYFVEGTITGVFAHNDTITGGTSGATATVNNAAAAGGPTSTTPGATRVLVLNLSFAAGTPTAPPPFPCRPTGPLAPPPAAPYALPYVLTETTIDPYTQEPVTSPAPAAIVAFYSTSDLDTDGVATTPAIPAGSGAQVVSLTYMDSNGGGPFTVHTNLTGKFPALVTLASGFPLAEVTACAVSQAGAFANSVGQITLCALDAPPPSVQSSDTPDDFKEMTDDAQLTIARPLVYLPPSYFALAQQGASAPALAGDFLVQKGSSVVSTTVSQVGVLAGTNLIVFASQPDVQYEVQSVSATFVQLTSVYTGLEPAEIAPAAEKPNPAQSVSDETDRVVTSAALVSPSPAAPPTNERLSTLFAEFTLPQQTVPALTYSAESGGTFVGSSPGEVVKGQKSGATATVLYDDQNVDHTGVLAFNAQSVKKGFIVGETVTGQTSGVTATVVNPRTLATSPLPTKLSGLYARALSLVLGAPIVSQPLTLL